MSKPTHYRFRIECCALHTERPKWAAHAPAQVEAACLRGAHVIGLTEVVPHSRVEAAIASVAAQHSYTMIHEAGDTALLVKSRIKILHSEPFVLVDGLRGYSAVTLSFHRDEVTVFCQHWATLAGEPHQRVREAQTQALIDAMATAAKGKRLAFYMGDSNPGSPLSNPDVFPRAELEAAGLPLIYTELNTWPDHIGVTVMGRNSHDHRVHAEAVEVFDPLGSDHNPVGGTYWIERRPAWSSSQALKASR